MSHWFFFSYAHADQNVFLKKFYDDLAEKVRGRTGALIPESGFIDRDGIEHGAKWNTTLEEALQSCRVFVPIYSPSYFRSEYCGKEFKIFLDRLKAAQKSSASTKLAPLILPVLLNPESNIRSHLPAHISEFQYTHGIYPEEYLKEGILQLVQHAANTNSKYYNQYLSFLGNFADTVVNAAEAHPLPAVQSLTKLSEVASIFSPATRIAPAAGETGPRYVQFIFVAGKKSEMENAQRKRLKFYGQKGGSDWQPFLDSYQGSASALAIEAVESFAKNIHYEEVVLGQGIVEQIKEASSQGKIVVVVADTWTLKLKSYIDLVTPLDEYSSMNCITLILWNEEDQESKLEKEKLTLAVKGVFKTKYALSIKNFFPDSIKSSAKFKEELERALAEAQAKILETIEVTKIRDELIMQGESVAAALPQSLEFNKKPSL
jgi:FxsC-like protein